MREVDEAVADLWNRYEASNLGYDLTLGYGSVTLRNELVVSYTSLVRYVASRVGAGLPDQIERGELVSHGTLGLIDAISKFDPGKGNKFETYAVPRIRGEIIDQLRKQDRVPRSVRSKAREMARTVAGMESELGRAPDDSELAARLDISIVDLWVMQREAAVSALIPLDEHQGDDERPSIRDTIFDIGANPEDVFAQLEVVELLAHAVDAMTVRSKTILVLYYLHEMTLAEIGEVLGVTESRVCQLQSKLLQSLHQSLSSGRPTAA